MMESLRGTNLTESPLFFCISSLRAQPRAADPRRSPIGWSNKERRALKAAWALTRPLIGGFWHRRRQQVTCEINRISVPLSQLLMFRPPSFPYFQLRDKVTFRTSSSFHMLRLTPQILQIIGIPSMRLSASVMLSFCIRGWKKQCLSR